MTTGPARLRSASSLRCCMMRSYGLSLSGGRSRSRTRSISAMVFSPTHCADIRGPLPSAPNRNPAAPGGRGAWEPVRLGGDESCRLIGVAVEVLHDDAVGA